jgi:hypothetical protein
MHGFRLSYALCERKARKGHMDKKLMPFWEAVQRSMERRNHPVTLIAIIKKGAQSALID